MTDFTVTLGSRVWTIRAEDEALARDIADRLFPKHAKFGSDDQTPQLNVAALLAKELE